MGLDSRGSGSKGVKQEPGKGTWGGGKEEIGECGEEAGILGGRNGDRVGKAVKWLRVESREQGYL